LRRFVSSDFSFFVEDPFHFLIGFQQFMSRVGKGMVSRLTDVLLRSEFSISLSTSA